MPDERRIRPGTTTPQRRALRRDQTDAERALWNLVRAGQLDGLKFRRQHAVGRYILDFCCIDAGLAVELDGSMHDTAKGITHDETRTRFLATRGIRVLRFSDGDVLREPEGVVTAILAAARSGSPHLASPTGGRGIRT